MLGWARMDLAVFAFLLCYWLSICSLDLPPSVFLLAPSSLLPYISVSPPSHSSSLPHLLWHIELKWYCYPVLWLAACQALGEPSNTAARQLESLAHNASSSFFFIPPSPPPHSFPQAATFCHRRREREHSKLLLFLLTFLSFSSCSVNNWCDKITILNYEWLEVAMTEH